MSGTAEIERIVTALDSQSPSGCAIALHIHFTTPEYLHQTYSKAWSAIYSENGYVMQDPTVSWSFRNNGTIRWSDLAAQDTMNIYQKAGAYGISHGFACGVEHGGTRSVAGFARPDREFEAAEMQAIEALVLDLHAQTALPGTNPAAIREVFRQLSARFGRP